MGKTWQVLKRDILRLVRTRKVWVIVIGVLITPALYAWFNINAFWDPYSTTGNIRVAVVNLDKGASSELTGRVDVGTQVTGQLKDNHQLGWTFMGEDEAQDAVRSGSVYAAIVIPADFSEDLLSITTGDFTQPALKYYVNEKASAIAPKITDVGASTLDKEITSAFIGQVAEAATSAVKDAGEDAEVRLLNAKSDTLNAVDDASKQLAGVQTGLGEMQDSLTASRGTISSARATLDDVSGALGDVQVAIAQAQDLITTAQQQVIAFTDAATSAYVSGSSALADAAASANTAVARLSGAFDQANVRVDSAITDIQAVVTANQAAIDNLQALVDGGSLDPATAQRLTDAITTLKDRNAADQQLLTDLRALNDTAASTSQAISDASSAVAQATKTAQQAASGMRTALTDTVPALSSAMATLSTSAGQFSAAIGAQRDQIAQAQNLLSGLDDQIVTTGTALTGLQDNVKGIQQGLSTVRTDVVALSAASAWNELDKITGLNPSQIASFISSPVQVAEHKLFPVATYGSAMAALFTNLSLWIGAFVLMVIFKIEVDTEGVEDVTVRQAYLARFGLFAILVTGQALIVSIGDLIIGVQTASAVAFVGTSVLIGLAYLSIIYALSVAFGHVGRGLAVLLVIMQIPGASGLYPIEMMPDFFRAIYPFLPFTYGIDALRETIAGFYGGHWFVLMGVLAVFVALAFLLGLVLRTRLANFNALFNREIARTDLLIGENVQVTGTGPRLADVMRALGHREEFRDDLTRRATPYARHYPAFVRVTLLTAVVGIVILGVVAWLLPGAKAILLALWVGWCLLSIAFLIVIEYVKDSHERAQQVIALDDEQLREMALHGGLADRTHRVTADTTPTHTLPTTPVAAPPPDDDPDLMRRLFGGSDSGEGGER